MAVSAPPKSPRFSLRPLMFGAFSGSMAMMAFVALAGPIARVIGLQPWHMGTAVTIAGIAWMVMARVWGGLSDRRGRRPVLLLGFAGFAVSYLLLVLCIDLALRAILTPMLAFAALIVGRGVAGLFYAAVPATTAALVADHVGPEGRAGAMAAVGAASSAGMVIGPGIVGLMAPFSLGLPLYATAALPILAYFLLRRVLPVGPDRGAGPRRPVRLFDPRLRRAMTVAFVAMFSVSVAQITLGFFALDRLGLDPMGAANVAGIALAIVGGGLVCAQIVLRKLGWPPARLIRVGAGIGGLGFASIMLATTPFMLWASCAVAAFGMGWVYPSISALAANAVEAHEQGAAAGTAAAAQGLGSILGPIIGTIIYEVGNGAPYALVGALLIVTALWPQPDREERPT